MDYEHAGLISSGSDIQDWWSLPRDNSLSGGQIAGIVVSRQP